MSTLVSYSFSEPCVRSPPSQPSRHRVPISVMPKEPRETPGSAWPPSHLMYAACGACPAIVKREAVSTPELPLGEDKGVELLWWIVLKPPAKRVTAKPPAAPSPSSLQVATYIRSSQGYADTCRLAWLCSLCLITTKQLIHYREKIQPYTNGVFFGRYTLSC